MTAIKSSFSSVLFSTTLIVGMLLGGCGKVGQPRAPEYYAPEVVGQYAVSLVPEGVFIQWKSPKNDRKGKELKELDGYVVERAIVEPNTAISRLTFEEIAFLKDGHIIERDALRKKLKAENRPSRTADVDSSKKLFSYTDKSAEARDTSLEVMYRIVAINQGGVRGERSQIAYKKGASLVFMNNEDGADLLSND